MASKFIQVRLNQQQVQAMKLASQGNMQQHRGSFKNGLSKRDRSDSINSATESVIVEYSYQDTFTTLLDKCLVALNIRHNESSGTTRSNDDHSTGRGIVTKQALIYDKEHNLVTMLQEVQESDTYFIEIIDQKILSMNQMSSPMLPPSLEPNDSSGSNQSGSFNNFNKPQSRNSSLAGHRSSFAASVNIGVQSSQAQRSNTAMLSCDTDFYQADRSKSDLSILQISQRQTRFKVVLVGQARCGKTSLAYRFVDRASFLDDYEPTYVDTYEQEMNMIDPSDGLNRVVNLTICDIGHDTLKEQMLKDADAVLFCYDVTSEESYFALSSLFQLKMQMEYSTPEDEEENMAASMATLNQQIGSTGGGAPKQNVILRPVVLVGCKSDLSGSRQVDYLDAERTAESFKAPYIECSASTNHRVEDAFELILIQLFKKERQERDIQIQEQNKKMMLNGSIINNKNGHGSYQDESCCSIF